MNVSDSSRSTARQKPFLPISRGRKRAKRAMACLSLSPLVHREGPQWRVGLKKKRQADPDAEAPTVAKRVCSFEEPSARAAVAWTSSLLGEARLLSSEGRIFFAPSHLLVHMRALANEERRTLVDGHEVFLTMLPAAVLEHVISSLRQGSFLQARESVADNVELLGASEALSLPAEHSRALSRSLAHQIWLYAHRTGVNQLSLLGQLRLSPHAREQIALILTACS